MHNYLSLYNMIQYVYKSPYNKRLGLILSNISLGAQMYKSVLPHIQRSWAIKTKI